MGDADGQGDVPVAFGDRPGVGGEFDEPSVEVVEAQAVTAADLVEGAGFGDEGDAAGPEAAGASSISAGVARAKTRRPRPIRSERVRRRAWCSSPVPRSQLALCSASTTWRPQTSS